MEKVKEFFDHNYKKLLIIPLLVMLISIGIILNHKMQTGDYIDKDITLKGGVSVTVSTTKNVDIISLEKDLKSRYPNSDIRIRSITDAGKNAGVVIALTEVTPDQISDYVKQKLSVSSDDLAIESTGAALGASFFNETIRAILFAFAFMAIVIFLYFRIPIPSLAIILAPICTMFGTWAVLILIGAKLSTAGVAAMLMLIGYSVDTDILLTVRVLKRKSGVSIFEATTGAFKTGMIMTTTAIAVVGTCYFLSTSVVLKQIMLILLIGLFFDILNTWIQNAGILRMYLEKKGDKIKLHDQLN
ncbi:MAG: protein translocase subunit SecF [Nanoarchaeota archaeon]|nr:protein translocase subunit SecF [Nanoarchaeota archaeon]